jgi:hypothetical protein
MTHHYLRLPNLLKLCYQNIRLNIIWQRFKFAVMYIFFSFEEDSFIDYHNWACVGRPHRLSSHQTLGNQLPLTNPLETANWLISFDIQLQIAVNVQFSWLHADCNRIARFVCSSFAVVSTAKVQVPTMFAYYVKGCGSQYKHLFHGHLFKLSPGVSY